MGDTSVNFPRVYTHAYSWERHRLDSRGLSNLSIRRLVSRLSTLCCTHGHFMPYDRRGNIVVANKFVIDERREEKRKKKKECFFLLFASMKYRNLSLQNYYESHVKNFLKFPHIQKRDLVMAIKFNLSKSSISPYNIYSRGYVYVVISIYRYKNYTSIHSESRLEYISSWVSPIWQSEPIYFTLNM